MAVSILAALLLSAPALASHPLAPTPAAILRPAPQTTPERLQPNKQLERKLAGGEAHVFETELPANHVLAWTVKQEGIDVAVTLLSPNGARLSQINNRHGERGAETGVLLADAAGTYQIEIRSLRKTDQPGIYEIFTESPRLANESDRVANNAEQLISQSQALLTKPAAESLVNALTKLTEALALLDANSNVQRKAMVLTLIGRVHYQLADYPRSLDFQNQALAISRTTGDQYEEAAILLDLGRTFRAKGENEKALAHINQGLQVWQSLGDRRAECDALITAGRISYEMAEQHKALFYFGQALQLSRTLADSSAELQTLGGMALAHYVLGENEDAAENWQAALKLAVAGKNRTMEANLLGKLGAVYGAMGDTRQALAYLDRTVLSARERSDTLEEAAALQTIGRVYRSGGDATKSIEFLDQSLVLLKDVNSPTSFARAHYNLGKAYTDLGQYEKAIDYLNQALEVWKSRNDQVNIAATIRELARAERGRGNLETALIESQTALNFIERMRASAGGQEQRSTYLASVQDYFELQIDILTRLQKLNPAGNYAAAAFQTSERAKARSLLETLAEAGVDIRRGVYPDLLKREQTITEKLNAAASEYARLSALKSAPDALAKTNEQIKALSAQYENVEAEIRAASPRYGQMALPQPLSLTEIRQQVIDDQTVLLEYYLGSDRSYVWAVTGTAVETYELPKRSVIEAAARQVHEMLTARNRRVKFETAEERRSRVARADADYPEAARALSEMVLAPVSKSLQDKHLLIVADGALQYVPFAALPKPGAAAFEALTITNEVVSLPSASTLAVVRREVATHKPAPKTITVLADPVFDASDERVKSAPAINRAPSRTSMATRRTTVAESEIQRSANESGWEGETGNMARLPFTRKEAEGVAALVPASLRKEQLDFDANRSNATSSTLSQYRIVHFATHGFLNSRHPELSGIVLSLVDGTGRDQDGFLRAHEIYNLQIPAELVVLSGCRTGLGKEIRGEGLIGLTRAFMHAGAARVVVSLWDVNDEATAELMQRFYARLLGPEKLSPAAALRAAQVSMINDKRWSAPYYWAGFILQGEPR